MKNKPETRSGGCKRKTSETDITISLELESAADSRINSGVPFFDHMLSAMCRHGRMMIDLRCAGDNEIDDHHSVEDIGICFGTALKEALGEKKGICRFGEASAPMDEALASVVVDLSGRSFFKYTGPALDRTIGRYEEELSLEFFRAFADNAGLNLHVNVRYGDNRHHIHEAVYKALGMALRRAVAFDDILNGGVPSTKGTIA